MRIQQPFSQNPADSHSASALDDLPRTTIKGINMNIMNVRVPLFCIIALLIVTSPARADLLPGNFWVNSTFESGTNLDQTNGTPTNWTRGGGDTNICQVTTSNSVSSSHSLAVIDNNTDFDGYGEWYSDVTLSGNASPGDTLKIQWFEMYNTSTDLEHEMRLTVRFLDSLDNSVSPDTQFVAKGNSAGWLGTIEDSTFTKRNASLTVPLGAVKMRCALNSGGLDPTTGVMIIDDLSVAKVPTLLSGNFWVNSTFEFGTNLDQTTGTPTNWNRGGSDTSICQVITNNSVSSSHSLAVIDTNGFFGEWYSDVLLSGNASPGDALDIQWFEMYNVSGPEMRLTVRFLNASDNSVSSDTHFTTSGTSSAGWMGTIANSTFTKRNKELLVPVGAVKMRCALVSGGPQAITGVMVIDDLSVAVHPPTVLAGNFFPNPTFEAGEQLDNPALAAPAGIWLRGGQDGSINQVITTNSVSPTHSLALLDNNPGSYGEWYGFLPLTPFGVAEGDVLDLQWFQLYSVSSEHMRLSFQFQKNPVPPNPNGEAVGLNNNFLTTNDSPGWSGSIATSPFERRFERLLVPAGAERLRVNFASGGSDLPVGLMVIDDLSIRISIPVITSITNDTGGKTITWFSMPSKFYTVQFASTLGSPTVWTDLVTGLAGDPSLSNMYVDPDPHAGNTGFYQVIQE